MSREQARAALRDPAELATGCAWLPGELLDAVALQTGDDGRALAHAAAAASLGVDLAFVDAESTSADDEAEALHDGDIAVAWAVPGVLGRVCGDIGWAEALRLTVADPGTLALRLDEALHEALDDVRHGISADADLMLIADDLAGASGPLVPPDYALDALVPCYRRLALESSRADLPAIFHSDGDIRVLFPALKRAGFAAVHLGGLDPAAFEVDATAARAADLVVLGGVSAPSVLGVSRDAGERAGSFAASVGGVIVCDDGGLTSLEELAGVEVALEAARDAFARAR